MKNIWEQLLLKICLVLLFRFLEDILEAAASQRCVLQNKRSENNCEIFRKAHISESLSNKVVDLQPKILINWRLHHKNFSMNFAWFFSKEHLFYRIPPGDSFWYIENLTFKLFILNKFIYSINVVDTLYLISRNLDFVFWWYIKLGKHKPLLMFSGLSFYSWAIIGTTFNLKNLV